MTRFVCIVSTLVASLLWASVSRADYFLEFKPQGQLMLGGSVTVDIVLRETRIAGSNSDLATKFMQYGNFRFNWTGSSAFNVSLVEGHGQQGVREFDNGGLGPTLGPGDSSLLYRTVEQSDSIVDAATDPLGTIVSNVEASLRLGRFVLSGGALGETVTFQMVDFDSGADDIVFDDFTVLDSAIQYGSMDFSVSAVPEPSSILVLSALVGGVGLRQWRKRKAALNKSI